ncbi:uncharacterized protein LOC133195627 [Saccostrea echinata]|uniref:uncharacterized protein LOC133195627 n=1 Tax=Saccostrea echinata TaxID=191078 RepID=UPI002A7EECD9|nr:uncharacterized protein LOC133195627 [Saccostrea echinata]
MILRKIVTDNSDWDSPLPEQYRSEWESWKTELQCLQDINIRRTYMNHDASLSKAVRREIHLHSDASEDAIAAVAYLKTISQEGKIHVGIILGKAKVAPKHGNSIPRLELCGALLAVEIYDIAVNALDIAVDCVQFHIDSKVVLGYINNRVRRFYMYVSKRIERILRTTTPEQWTYVPTHMNPADCATRSLPASQMQNSPWLQGPVQLYKKGQNEVKLDNSTFSLVDPENDKEIKLALAVHVVKSSIEDQCIFGTHRFNKFSSWTALVRAFAFLRNKVCAFKQRNVGNSSHLCVDYKAVETFQLVERWIIERVQRETFPEEYSCLLDKRTLSRNRSLLTLDPFLNQHGLICVGGRLRDSDLGKHEKFPVILPRKHHISTLLVRHYHEQVKHQGRFFTESMIRSAGFWIVGAKRLISSVIHACVKCKRLRGRLETQKMADLPVDRVSPAPPFSYTGVDVFGPWSVVTRRTRGGQASSKRWGVIFTCLSIRAIHMEVVEELSSSSFINALRRFTAIRGQVKELRSDRGRNFVGCTKDLQIEAINVEDAEMKKFLFDKGTVWRFNPPHSSHMGGVWERMIKTTRNILDSMLSEVSDKNLTHEVLTTFMCEVCTIINARPIVAITSDPTNPFLLSPSTLLTQRTSADVQPFVDLNPKDMYKEQWRRVQYLAERFWNRWKQEYLQTLQPRRKWQCDKTNLNRGDTVLLKEPESHRNNWPLGMVENAICGKDGRVRKAEVRITKNGFSKTYTRPVTELVLLLSDKGNDLDTSTSDKE